jgi:N-acetylglutamate synthase-like GNAT family acetyltransferase
MDARPYQPTDRAGCLQVFDSLAPHLIAPEARHDFEAFLNNPASPYFVLEHDDAIAGCGGFALSPGGDTATLLWGMVRSDVQRLGLGRFLLLYRMREIGKAATVQTVHAETSVQSAPFFEKQGFRVQGVANGRVELIKKLTVCR